MTLPSIYHPTNRPNFSIVRANGYVLWFSYQTLIAFSPPDEHHTYITENVWSATTGKHLNHIDPDKRSRLPREEFLAKVEEHFGDRSPRNVETRSMTNAETRSMINYWLDRLDDVGGVVESDPEGDRTLVTITIEGWH